MEKYSENELKMIQSISPHWHRLISENKDSSIGPLAVYRVLVEQCFLENKTGPAVEALRRGLNAFNNGKVFRNTTEWESLISF
jgi:hypothetical protein